MEGISKERLAEILHHWKSLRNECTSSAFIDGSVHALELLIIECKELNSWKLIDENTPKDRMILLFYPDVGRQITGSWSINHRSFDTQTLIFGKGEPTHWQELPEDPE